MTGVHNDNEGEKGVGRSVNHSRKRLTNFSHGSRITKFRILVQRAWR